MAFSNLLLFPILSHPILTLTLTPLLLILLTLLYRISPLHPLSHIPSPITPRLTSLYLTYHAWRGTECRAIHALHRTHGPILRTGPNSIDISSGHALHGIYVANGGFAKPAFYANFDIDGHRSIFSETDPTQRAPRAKAVVALFSTASLRQGSGVIGEVIDHFVRRLLAEKAKAKGKGRRVNLLDLTRGLAVDVVSSYLLGRRYGGLDGPAPTASDEKRHGKYEHGPDEPHMSASGMVDSFVAVGRFWYLPTWAFTWAERLDATIHPPLAAAHTSMAVVDDFVARCVQDAAAAVEAQTESPTAPSKDGGGTGTFPARLLQAGISADETRAQCKDLIFAGTDSTGMNMAVIMWQLARHPACYAAVKRELAATSSPVDAQSLPYLRGVVREGLRLSMANPSRLPRVVPRGGWEFDGLHMPAGTVVSCTPYELHLDGSVWAEPEAFRPERWVGATVTEEMGRDWIPFGLGTRQCIARNLAMVELCEATRAVVRSGVLDGARVVEERIEILEWFNSKVVGERVELVWD